MKEETTPKKRRPSGAYCVYFEYKMKGETIPQVILTGSEEQCKKHVSDYNRQTPELYRCQLKIGRSDDIYGRISELKQKYHISEEAAE